MDETIRNIIILGRAVPEQIKDGRKTVCVAGYSHEIGFVRLYPSRADSPLKTWQIIDAAVERNPQDTRAESYKFKESKNEWENLNSNICVVGEMAKCERYSLLNSITSSCVSAINDSRLSLGIIRPSNMIGVFGVNQLNRKAYQPLFDIMPDSNLMTKRDFQQEPRLRYVCGENCQSASGHDQQLLDWGCYQWMKKNPNNCGGIWKNMHIGERNWSHFLLVGNQARHRTSYMCIAVIWMKTPEAVQASFF